MKNDNKGFSLIELIVVIAIMAILVGVMAPQVIKYIESSKQSTDMQNAAAIKSTVEVCVADGSITTNVNVAVSSDKKNLNVTGATEADTNAIETALGAFGISNSVELKSEGWNAGTVGKYDYDTFTWDTTGITANTNNNAPANVITNVFR